MVISVWVGRHPNAVEPEGPCAGEDSGASADGEVHMGPRGTSCLTHNADLLSLGDIATRDRKRGQMCVSGVCGARRRITS